MSGSQAHRHMLGDDGFAVKKLGPITACAATSGGQDSQCYRDRPLGSFFSPWNNSL